LHREEFYLQLLQEKDTEYNALVKTLKDRVG
jgi:neurabin